MKSSMVRVNCGEWGLGVHITSSSVASQPLHQEIVSWSKQRKWRKPLTDPLLSLFPPVRIRPRSSLSAENHCLVPAHQYFVLDVQSNRGGEHDAFEIPTFSHHVI